jgi:hypothetical protein
MKDEYIEYELILETHNEGDRALLKSILDAEGVKYYFQGEHVAPYLYRALPMRLMVKKDQATVAREILKDIELSFSYGGSINIEDIADDDE